MSELKPVTFAKVWRGYNVGETAGFPDDVADTLVSNGTAVVYDENAAKPKRGGRAATAAPKPAATSAPVSQAPTGAPAPVVDPALEPKP
ncbi:hypothetical protein OU997_05270 [Pseudomonas sp. SL4(2022)]|uniref:hypothetical protein n=1 Tax=Pseudomonas sp. SL4(2022) TaxID=2994661 RepID=UPI00226F37D5|nr:hypothetical protein [Pseudomonas sp. SL4(2022)]WAC45583.1 hypothetical protein OU997_05270 [Pseudomonas sp. SL4(2022)]